ncbi:MAG: TOBE domain-containing protein, partial [Anaerolineae bacterium]|nr:TOBE domain-containing protein [Anaerolineae bacterium]
RSFISKLHQRLGTTFVYVTHDQVEAMTMGTRICVMSAGEIQQVDTPFNLYHNPRNLFVAGFIGSPSMNFFDGTVKLDGGAMKIETSSFTLTLPPGKAALYQAVDNERVTLGIRPEDIHDADYQPGGITPAMVEANVEVVEQMGNEMILYLEDKGKSYIARTDPRTKASVGKRMNFALNLDNLHLFDAQSELSLAYESKQKEMPAATAANAVK